MRWRDLGEERHDIDGSLPGLCFMLADEDAVGCGRSGAASVTTSWAGRLVVAPQGTPGQVPDLSRWIVWDVGVTPPAVIFRGHFFKSKEAAQKAAEVLATSPIIRVALLGCMALSRLAVASYGAAASLAVMMAEER